MDPVSVMAATPGVLALQGRSFVILAPTTGDKHRVHERMKELVRAKCVSPLDYALQHTHLPPAALALAVSEALKLGGGGGVKPHIDAVWDEYVSVEGVRWRVWYHAHLVLKDLALDDVSELVTADNFVEVSDALDAALNFRAIDPNAPAPATGSGS